MSDSRFAGISIMVAALIVAGALAATRFIGPTVGQYQFQQSGTSGIILILDTQTGEVRRQMP